MLPKCFDVQPTLEADATTAHARQRYGNSVAAAAATPPSSTTSDGGSGSGSGSGGDNGGRKSAQVF